MVPETQMNGVVGMSGFRQPKRAVGVEAGQREIGEDDVVRAGGQQSLEAAPVGREGQVELVTGGRERLRHQLGIEGGVLEAEDTQ